MKQKNPFAHLTWGDLESWVDPRTLVRGKALQKSSAVEGLSLVMPSRLIAWVQGTEKYVTDVIIMGDHLWSNCTCPVGSDCKHGVAVLLEYSEACNQKREVPQIDAEDPRLAMINEAMDASAEELYEIDEFDVDEYDDDEDYDGGGDDSINGADSNDEELSAEGETPGEGRPGRASGQRRLNLKSYLRKLSKEELVTLVEELSSAHAEVGRDLWIRCSLAAGRFEDLVRHVRAEIDRVTADKFYYDRWRRIGSLPDYSNVRDGLSWLLDEGRADDVYRLGKRLFSQAREQVEMVDDDGETAAEVSETMEIVFKALGVCSLADADKMEAALDFELMDDYGLCGGVELFWKRSFPRAAWSELADRILVRLGDKGTAEDRIPPRREYCRTLLSERAIIAMKKAGRRPEIIPFCEREAVKDGSYERLADYLIKAKRFEETEEWIRRGIAAVRERWPGIEANLKEQLGRLKVKQGDWAFDAALTAEEFFEHPSLFLYKELKRKTSKHGGAWDIIRAGLWDFLDRGDRPRVGEGGWPLPESGLKQRANRGYRTEDEEVRIEIALFDKDIDRALAIYKAALKSDPSRFDWVGFRAESIHAEMARAAARRYPDEALAIWKKLVQGLIGQTKPASYRSAVPYLKKIRGVYERTNRRPEWGRYVESIRIENARKRKLMEVLDGLEEKPIIKS